jgi:hypothetical protein
MDNMLIDFRRRGSHYECTTVAAIKEICERVRRPFLLLLGLPAEGPAVWLGL